MLPYLQTVLSSTAIIVFFVGLLVYLVFRNEDDNSAKTWFLGCILMSSGMLILLIRSHLPNFIGFAVNNFIMIYAMVLFRNSFWMIENPHFKSSIFPLLFCLYHGMCIWIVNLTPYASEIGAIAAINWTLLYIWLFYDSLKLEKIIKNNFFFSFLFVTFLGIIAWSFRILLSVKFNIVSASDQQSWNALSLLIIHIILVSAQLIYIIVRLTDEKNKKTMIRELNSNLEIAWTEKARIEKERNLEKNALLRDIHDGFGSQLASLRILIEKDCITSRQLSESLKELTLDLYLIIDTLNNDNLNFNDAITDMRYRSKQYLANTETIIKWNIDTDDLPNLPSKSILNILRIIQEAIANSLKHSHARNIDVNINYMKDRKILFVSVSDDGIGITDNTPSGRGLSNMRYRAGELNGNINISSPPLNGGTTVALTIAIQ